MTTSIFSIHSIFSLHFPPSWKVWYHFSNAQSYLYFCLYPIFLMLLFYLFPLFFSQMIERNIPRSVAQEYSPVQNNAIRNCRIITLSTLTTRPTEPVLTGYNFLVTLAEKKKTFTLLVPNPLRSLVLLSLCSKFNLKHHVFSSLAHNSVVSHKASCYQTALTVIIFANNFIFCIFPCVMS